MGSSIILPVNDYGVEVARGNVSAASCFSSLGERSGLAVVTTGADVWHGTANQLPEPPDIGEQMTVVSTSVNDASAGSGAQTVRIEYLDASGAEQTEDVVLSGTTPVNTTAVNIRFVNAIYSVAVGATGVAEGDITIYQLGAPATIYNMIQAGGNMSLTSSRMVPAGKSFYLSEWAATSTVQNQQVTIRIRATQRDGTLIDGVFLFIDSCVLEVSNYNKSFACPVRIPPLAIIKVSAWASQAGTDVSASFDGYLITD